MSSRSFAVAAVFADIPSKCIALLSFPLAVSVSSLSLRDLLVPKFVLPHLLLYSISRPWFMYPGVITCSFSRENSSNTVSHRIGSTMSSFVSITSWSSDAFFWLLFVNQSAIFIDPEVQPKIFLPTPPDRIIPEATRCRSEVSVRLFDPFGIYVEHCVGF